MPIDPLTVAVASVKWRLESLKNVAATYRSRRSRERLARKVLVLADSLGQITPKRNDRSKSRAVAKARRFCRNLGRRLVAERRTTTPEELRQFHAQRSIALERT